MIAVLYVNGLSPALFNQLKYHRLLSLLKGEEGCEEKHLQHLPGDFPRSRSERVRLIRTAGHRGSRLARHVKLTSAVDESRASRQLLVHRTCPFQLGTTNDHP